MHWSPLGRPIRVGVFEHDPDAFNCFRNLPRNLCKKPGAEMEIIRIVMRILDWPWEVVVAPNVNKRDLARRAGIQDKMEAFSLQILSAAPTADEISKYLLDMSQHVTHKSHKKKWFYYVDTEKEFGVVNDFGTVQENGNFSGIMGLLANNSIDMGGLSMRVTPERMEVAHFTFPIRYFQQVYIIKTPPDNDFRNFIFSPFGTQLWVLLLFTVVGVALIRFLIAMLLYGICNKKLNVMSNSVLEVYGIMLKQRVPNPSAFSLMILEILLISSMLVIRSSYQSTMNSKLTAPPTTDVPFRTQSQLLDLLERKVSWPTYYADIQLEGSNEQNQARIGKIFEYNPVRIHGEEPALVQEIQRGGVFYSTYDIEFLPDPVSIWDKKQGLTVIRDTSGIISYVAFGFSSNNKKLCEVFNKALIRILPGISSLILGPGYGQKKWAEDYTIQAKRTPLSVQRHLLQLFIIFAILTAVSIIVFVTEYAVYHADKYLKARRYDIQCQEEQRQSTIIDLNLF